MQLGYLKPLLSGREVGPAARVLWMLMQPETRRDRWLRPRAEQGTARPIFEQSKPPGPRVPDRPEPPPSSPPLPGKQELFLGPRPAQETHPGALNPLCAGGTPKRRRFRCIRPKAGYRSRIPSGLPSVSAAIQTELQVFAPAAPGRPAPLQPGAALAIAASGEAERQRRVGRRGERAPDGPLVPQAWPGAPGALAAGRGLCGLRPTSRLAPGSRPGRRGGAPHSRPTRVAPRPTALPAPAPPGGRRAP